MATFSTPNLRRFPEDDHLDEDPAIWYFCFGNCASIDTFLNQRNGKAWLIPKFLNSFFRGIGQVVFANNPFSGILIFTGLLWYSLALGVIVFLSTTVAIVTALLLKQNPMSVSSGLVSFNAVLLASVTSSLWTPLYNQPQDVKLWVFILVGSSFSVFISSGLTNIVSSIKPTVPILSIPFHILAFVTFACLKPPNMNMEFEGMVQDTFEGQSQLSQLNFPEMYNYTTLLSQDEDFFVNFENATNEDFYSWGTVQNGLLAVGFSAGQVFGVADLLSSLLIYTAILIYSPILTFMCFLGAVIGTVLGFVLTPFPNDEVLLGVWGFNGFLSSGAIGLFYIFNWYSCLNAVASAIFTAILQASLASPFSSSRMPMFGLPFILSTILFVCVTSNGRGFVRASKISFPEMQRRNYLSRNEMDEDVESGRKLVNAV